MSTPSQLSPIYILFCVDNRYLRQAGVALASILEANPRTPIAVTIAALNRDQARSDVIFGPLLARNPDCRLTFRDLAPDLFVGLPVTEHFSQSIYARIVFDRFLDPRCERVLYLDADTVVRADLRPLWATPLDGAILAAARDPFRLDPEAIGFGPDEPYFNSGVLLIDRARWRAEDCERRVLDYLAKEGRRLPWIDQDALNVILRGQVRFIGLEWNYQPRCADVPPAFLGLNDTEYAALRAWPKLVHYTTSLKPWNAAYQVHYSRLFLTAAARAGLAFDLKPTRARTLGQRRLQAQTWLRWHFPRAFRAIRGLLRPKAAALMYRAGPNP